MGAACLALFVALLLAAPYFAWASTPAPEPDLSYRFVPSGDGTDLSIEVRLRGGEVGFTVLGFCLTTWPGYEDCGQDLQSFKVRSASTGERLAVEKPGANLWIVDHPPKEPLVVSYSLAATAASSASPFAPRVGPDSITFVADTVLMVPEHLVGPAPVRVEYGWGERLPESWIAASSLGLGSEPRTSRLRLNTFLHSLFFAGPAHVHREPEHSDLGVRVVWMDRRPPPPGWDRFVGRLATVRTALSRELSEEIGEVRNFFVASRPHPPINAVALGPSVLFFPDSAAFSGADGATASLFIAHELIHTSPRFDLDLVGSPLPETFLSEALAEYLARRSLLRAGILTLSDWSDAVSAKLGRLGGDEGSSVDPYLHGDLVFLMIDQRLAENGTDLLSWWMELHAEASGRDDEMAWADFLTALDRSTSQLFSEQVAELLQGRKRLVLPDTVFGECFNVETLQRRKFDPGFAVDSSLAARRALQVREGGPAWRAGLRNEDRLLEWSFHRNRADLPVRLVVERDGETRKVTYLPQGAKLPESRQKLVLNDPAACSPLAGGPVSTGTAGTESTWGGR